MDNFRAIRRVLWITLGLNLVATVAKLIVGYWTGSLSLIADGFDSVFDSASNVIGLVGIYLAARPADEDHPYGHRKAETMTALIISSLLFITAWELAKSAVERLRDPALIQAEVNVWSFGALLVSIVVHLTVVWYELRAGRRLHSDVLVADALHTRADIFVSLSVIGGLIAVRLGYPVADPILALIISLVIVKIGIDIIRESSPTLMDEAAMPSDAVEQIAMAVPGVLSCHRVRSRGHESAVYADLHIRVDPATSTDQAHAIAHQVQRRLRERFPGIQDVTIHVEPHGPSPTEPGREGIAVQLHRLADESQLGIHNVWAVENEVDGRYHAEAHLEVDGTLSLREAHTLASALEERARAEIPDLVELTTHIEPRGQLVRPAQPGLEEMQVAQAVGRIAHETLDAGTCHQVQVRQSGGGWVVSMHCQLPGDVLLAEAHRIITRLEAQLQEQVPRLERVVIHAEPEE
ncbi:MAG: cation diffusion facilitator family transporter [Pseudomonas stutzeri]|nr:cation diffusion facilitator family transporter [Stutzerimonas stutzeri]